MSDTVADVRYRLVPDANLGDARRAGDQIAGEVEGSVGARTGAMHRIGAGFMTALTVGAGAVVGGGFIAHALVGSASDLAETRSKVEQIFGAASVDLNRWAEGAATTFGQSQRQALDAASAFAIFGQSAGLSGDDLVGFSSGLTELASDLASFNNTSPEEAIEAIGAALRGESEPIRRYGVLLDDATLKAEAMALGIYDGTGSLTQQQRVLAAQAAIMRQTSQAQGDFDRTSDGLANRQRILAARFEDTKAKLGEALLPVALRAMEGISAAVDWATPYLQRFAEWLGERLPPFMERVQEIAQRVFGWLQENVPPILERIQAVAAVVFPKIAEFVQWVATRVEEYWPRIQEIVVGVVEAVRVAIERFVDVVTFIWEHFGDNIVNFVTDAWGAISRIIDGVLQQIKGIVDVFVGVFTGDWGRAWDGIKGIVQGAWDQIRGIVGLAWELLKAAVGVAFEALANLLSAGWDAVVRKVYEVWSFVVQLFGNAWESIKQLAGAAISAVAGALAAGWEGIRNAAGTVLLRIVEYFAALPGAIIGALGDLASLLFSRGGDLIRGLGAGVYVVWGGIWDWFRRLPNAIVGAIGDLSRVLWEAGRQIINGLWNGMKSAWEGAKSWLSGLGSVISFLKGPPEVDKVLLVGNGRLIMEGLARGMEQGWRDKVAPLLEGRTVRFGVDAQGLTGGLGAGLSSALSPSSGGGAMAGPTYNVEVVIQAWPGTDAPRVGREAAVAIRQGLLEVEAAEA